MKRNPITGFIKESYQELKRVVWPKKSDVIKKTIIVVVSMVIIAALIGLLDYGLSQGVGYLISLN